jgi:hypothetical protein
MHYYRSRRFRHRPIEAPAATGLRWQRLRRSGRCLVSLGVGLVGGYTVSKVWAETP